MGQKAEEIPSWSAEEVVYESSVIEIGEEDYVKLQDCSSDVVDVLARLVGGVSGE